MKTTLSKSLKPTAPFLLFALILCSPLANRAQTKDARAEIVASGGAFTLEKVVAAGGGTKKDAAPFNENGTTGQAAAGIRSTGGGFALYSGFWTPDSLAPTAASAVVGGRVLTA